MNRTLSELSALDFEAGPLTLEWLAAGNKVP